MTLKFTTTRFKAWQFLLLMLVTVLSLIYALPNLYGEDPSVQISLNSSVAKKYTNNAKFTTNMLDPKNIQSSIQLVTSHLKSKNLKPKHIKIQSNQQNSHSLIIHFYDSETEIAAKEALQDLFGEDYNVALNLAPSMPNWLNIFGAKPMKLGLDLRGGVRLLMEVDVNSVLNTDQTLKSNNVNEINAIKNSIMERTIATIRNRVNELGVAEAVVQRQGNYGIVVELPGVQDTGRAKNILGKTATLQFVMVDEDGILGPSNRFLNDRFGRKVLVKKKVVLGGDSIIGATSGFDSRDNRAVVYLRLSSGNKTDLFKKITAENIGKLMAIVYKENKVVQKNSAKSIVTEETIISIASIQSPLGNNFQITGFSMNESRDLALLLRSGAMPATVSIVEESIIGPSLGQSNIKMGVISVILGLSLVLIAMICYYSLFGLIANIALLLNLILLVAVMSVIEATLTLPGIAGIVLTLGMAVDANVLIFERIREELRLGATNLASINRGFEYAFGTILDSNLTTLIVGIILFFVGTGPVKGFAVVLSIGILTSLFTAITGTRVIVSILYEGKYHLRKILVGI
jgi:preprotein translocase subunit SecD